MQTQIDMKPDGSVVVSPIGLTGQGCVKATEDIERALGVVGERELTDSYRQVDLEATVEVYQQQY